MKTTQKPAKKILPLNIFNLPQYPQNISYLYQDKRGILEKGGTLKITYPNAEGAKQLFNSLKNISNSTSQYPFLIYMEGSPYVAFVSSSKASHYGTYITTTKEIAINFPTKEARDFICVAFGFLGNEITKIYPDKPTKIFLNPMKFTNTNKNESTSLKEIILEFCPYFIGALKEKFTECFELMFNKYGKTEAGNPKLALLCSNLEFFLDKNKKIIPFDDIISMVQLINTWAEKMGIATTGFPNQLESKDLNNFIKGQKKVQESIYTEYGTWESKILSSATESQLAFYTPLERAMLYVHNIVETFNTNKEYVTLEALKRLNMLIPLIQDGIQNQCKIFEQPQEPILDRFSSKQQNESFLNELKGIYDYLGKAKLYFYDGKLLIKSTPQKILFKNIGEGHVGFVFEEGNWIETIKSLIDKSMNVVGRFSICTIKENTLYIVESQDEGDSGSYRDPGSGEVVVKLPSLDARNTFYSILDLQNFSIDGSGLTVYSQPNNSKICFYYNAPEVIYPDLEIMGNTNYDMTDFVYGHLSPG